MSKPTKQDTERARRFLVTRAPVTLADESVLAAEFAAVREERDKEWRLGLSAPFPIVAVLKQIRAEVRHEEREKYERIVQNVNSRPLAYHTACAEILRRIREEGERG